MSLPKTKHYLANYPTDHLRSLSAAIGAELERRERDEEKSVERGIQAALTEFMGKRAATAEATRARR